MWGHERAWPFANAMIPTFHSDAYDMWMRVIPPRPLPKAIYMTPGGFHSFEHRWALDQAFVFHQAIGKPRVTQRIHDLNDHLKQGLAKMRRVTLRTPLSRDLSAGLCVSKWRDWRLTRSSVDCVNAALSPASPPPPHSTRESGARTSQFTGGDWRRC